MQSKPINVHRLAWGHRLLLVALLLQVGCLFVIPAFFGIRLADSGEQPIAALVGGLGLFSVPLALVSITMIVSGQEPILSLIIYLVGSIIPCIGFFVMWSVFTNATEELRRNNVKVGLLGADMKTVTNKK